MIKFYDYEFMQQVKPKDLDRIRTMDGFYDFHFNYPSEEYTKDNTNCRHSFGIYTAETPQELDQRTVSIEAVLCKSRSQSIPIP